MRLRYEEGALSLLPDVGRPIAVQPIMLNRLSVIAERDEVIKLTRAALPGVMSEAFGRLPPITLPTLELRVFDERVKFRVLPRITGALRRADHWRIEFDLEIGQRE